MGMGLRNSAMEISMRGTFKMDLSTVKESLCGTMEGFTKAILRSAIFGAKESLLRIRGSMKDSSKKI